MSETTLEIVKLIFSFFGSTAGTFIGFLSGMKLRDYRITQLEKKQSSLADKQEIEENEIGELKIVITAQNGKIANHEDRLLKGEKQIQELQKYHMKRNDA